jgi:hypothetical protein
MIYLWKIPDDYPQELIGEYQRDQSPDRFVFMQGVFFDEQKGTPHFKFNSSSDVLNKYQILPNSTLIPLVSAKVAEYLEKNCSSDVQLIPTVVSTFDKVLEGYRLVNVLNMVSAIKHSESKVVYIAGTKRIMKIVRLSLEPACLKDHSLAREKDYSSFLYVSEALKQVFEANSWNGYYFKQPEEIRP